ncbi:MAG: tyrosine-type recombinase/integrase [Bacteroidales bacterium]|nr:tyrosine-type recombinase/integrase [Bacteroidales bacterium]
MIEEYLKYLKKEKRYSNHTILSYKNDLYSFKKYLENTFENITFETCTPTIIRSWLADLAEKKHSPKTLRRKKTSLSSFYKYLIYMNITKSNPTKNIPMPKIPLQIPVFVDERSILEIINNNDNSSDDFISARNALILEMLYATGIRLSELITLKDSDIDYHKLLIKIRGKRDKERIIPFSNELLLRINQYNKLKKDFFEASEIDNNFFLTNSGKQLYPKFVYRIVNDFLSENTNLSKKSPHVLRHTFATHLLQNGADLKSIKDLLGHSSLASTQIYTHTNIKQLKKVYDKTHPKS